jgi:ABC-type ATPase involved in cell division
MRLAASVLELPVPIRLPRVTTRTRDLAVEMQAVSAGYNDNHVLDAVDLQIRRGEFLGVVGRSGSGKSTLLKLLYGALAPQSGTLHVAGLRFRRSSVAQVMLLRRRVGCVFQSYELLPALSALENVVFPLKLAHPHVADPYSYAREALELVGLAHKHSRLPSELSGGEQQRLAIARAVAHEPQILLADEPTGNLDRTTARSVVEVFRLLHQTGGTIVLASHDEELLAGEAQRIVRVEDGGIREVR